MAQWIKPWPHEPEDLSLDSPESKGKVGATEHACDSSSPMVRWEAGRRIPGSLSAS